MHKINQTQSQIKLSDLGEHWYNKILSLLFAEVSHLLLRPTEKNQWLGPYERFWAEILGISSTSLNLIFQPVLFNPNGSSH